MTGEQLKAQLAAGGRVYGTMTSLARNPRWAKVLAGVGLDYVIVDTEHSPFSRGEVADVLAMLARAGVCPFMRVPIPDSHYITMARDAGAQGILAPYCETVAQVKEVVGAAKWRPLKGTLLDRVLDTGQFASHHVRPYLENWNKDAVVVIGIESTPAIDNLEAILDVAGVDAIFVGPHDLSISVGVPEQYDHPEFDAAMQRVMDVCDARHVPVMFHLFNQQLQQKWMRAGVRFVLHYSDVTAMADGFCRELNGLRRCGADLEGKPAPPEVTLKDVI